MKLATFLTTAILGVFSGHDLLAQGSPRTCGVERWRVKVVVDADAARIDTTLTRSTVAQLREMPRPLAALSQRRVAPYELTTYRVIAGLREVSRPENDGDLHLLLHDLEDSSKTMIAEVPDSACALGSRHIREFAAAYRLVQSVPRDAIVIVDGIGFFDSLHGQRGVAPNGFELHPILAIRVVGQFSAQARPDSSGLRETGADQSTATSTKVWVNSASMVYHCQGSRWYGATKRGAYMTQGDAMKAGARPAYGRRCR
jgi:hypothetical protein